jgi:HEAT repeat protein
VALSLLQRTSANARLEGVSWTNRVDRPDPEVSSALLTALNHDPNVNVRLSSVNALQAMTSDAAILRGLVDSVATQDSPLVQITLIDALVQSALMQTNDTTVANELRTIAQGEQFNREVRDRALWGLRKLGVQ